MYLALSSNDHHYIFIEDDEFTKNFSEYHLMNLKALDEK
jgi:hypothetical protein